MAWLIALLVAAGAAGCTSTMPAAPGGPVNVQLVLAPGEVGNVAAAGIGVRFQRVIGDSRCPAGAFCIQGGDAIVRLDVLQSDGRVVTYDLHTGNLQPAVHGDLTIALENLSPYPFSSRTIEPDAYRATLRVTR
jgi:hypothetical protein